MSQWPFVIAAYLVAIGGTFGVVLASYVAMRRAEAAAESLRRE